MKATIFLLLFLDLVLIHSHEVIYKCGVYDEKVPVIPAKNFVKIDKNHPAYKRRLSDGEFKDFHIYLDLVNIKNDINKFNLKQNEQIYIESLKKAVKILETLLKVKTPSMGFKFTDEKIKQIKIDDWDKTIVGTNAPKDTAELDIDLIIFGRFDDTMPESTLASAGPRYTDPETGRPIIGIVNINTKIDYTKLGSEHFFQTIILHEFTHVLGFLNDFFVDKFKNIISKTDSDGIVRSYINSPKVLEVARKYYNCPDLDGVELEEYGGEGTVGSHWDARILLGDYMNGVTYPEEEVISEITLALLEDTGFYKPYYYTGGLMRFGKGKGCDFLKNKCVNSEHKINPLFENEFFDKDTEKSIDASCSSGRQSRAYHFLSTYESLPGHYQYYQNNKLGGWGPADYCPVSLGTSQEKENNYYVGRCSSLGGGEYGSKIYYLAQERININKTHYQIRTFSYSNISGDITDITGETFSDNSFCYQSSLIKEGINFNSTLPRAICYESFCSDRSLTIKIKDDYFVCPREGGKIQIEGYNGFFLCADYNLICSGTIMCNDLFDCVEKKSLTKESSYNYDYTPLTSQNIENIVNKPSDDIDNYELSQNGICPQNCKQCQANKKCIKCRNDFEFVASKESEEIICVSETECKGYYQEDGIYYKCMFNCDMCENGETCTQCTDGFDYDNNSNRCITNIENCQNYGIDSHCTRCVNNFYMINDDKLNCISTSNIQKDEYYLNEEQTIYYSCNNINYNNIENCRKCSQKNSCTLCKDGYTFINGDKTSCVKIETLQNNKYIQDPNDNSNYIKCDNIYSNCDMCNNIRCLTCKNNFNFINDDFSKCVSESSTTEGEPENTSTNKPANTPTDEPSPEPENGKSESQDKNGNNAIMNKIILIQFLINMIMLL